MRYVDRIRRSPYVDFDCTAGMANGGWTKLKKLGWKYRQHRNYNTLYTMPGVQRKDIVVGYNSFENDKEAMEFISMLKGEDESDKRK